MCLAILAGTCKAARAVYAVNTIAPPLLNSALVVVAPSPSITGLAQPVALALSQDITVTARPSFSSITINPADTLLNPLDHNIGNMTDAEFQALLHMALLSGGSVHGGDEMDTV
ncbi:hypothetical protein DFH08DRAFT_823092 [Mycena albidolilacea]|uniref:Uncharacterized protein n=1 Tax=Mycena albidolilacea TaxID=1033008 RepID=A0AAD6Z7H1_9AGAR|nr:hypothetical protein DFH08DRAFT_823092 [Mycena albidolilacea]